jgi:hypothetical protein
LAAFLAALLLFFLPEGVVAAALSGTSLGGCAADAFEPSSAATLSASGESINMDDTRIVLSFSDNINTGQHFTVLLQL